MRSRRTAEAGHARCVTHAEFTDLDLVYLLIFGDHPD